MKVVMLAFLVLIVPKMSFAETPRSYADASAIWQRNRDTAQYKSYAAEFSQFNNHFHLDEKDGCYALGPKPVNLMLVIGRRGNDEFAVVERVLSDVDNAKARCFMKSYSGVSTKMPPFLPFVLQLSMS